MTRQRKRPRDLQGGENLGKVGGELVDPVGVHRSAARPTVAAVVVGDAANPAPPPTAQLAHLGVPALLREAKAVQQNDGGVAGSVRTVVTNCQANAVTRGHRPLDAAIPRYVGGSHGM